MHVVHPMHTVRVRVLGQPLPPPKRRVYVYRRKQAEQAMQAEQVTQTEPTPDMRMWSQQTILNFLQQINVRDHASCVNVENLYVKS